MRFVQLTVTSSCFRRYVYAIPYTPAMLDLASLNFFISWSTKNTLKDILGRLCSIVNFAFNAYNF